MDVILSKPGQYGTLHLYAVEILHPDPGFPREVVRRWGYSADHAEDRVVESPDWCEEDRIGTVARVKA